MELKIKRDELEKLKQMLLAKKRQQNKVGVEVSRIEKKKRMRQLMIAGTLFEKAGIIDNYDPELSVGALYTAYRIDGTDPLYDIYKAIGRKLLNE